MGRKPKTEVNININGDAKPKVSKLSKVVGFFKKKGKTHPLSVSPPSATDVSPLIDDTEVEQGQIEGLLPQPKDPMEQFKEEIEAKVRTDLWELRAGNRIVLHNTLGTPIGVLLMDKKSPDHEIIYRDFMHGEEETVNEKKAYKILKDHYTRELSLPV